MSDSKDEIKSEQEVATEPKKEVEVTTAPSNDALAKSDSKIGKSKQKQEPNESTSGQKDEYKDTQSMKTVDSGKAQSKKDRKKGDDKDTLSVKSVDKDTYSIRSGSSLRKERRKSQKEVHIQQADDDLQSIKTDDSTSVRSGSKKKQKSRGSSSAKLAKSASMASGFSGYSSFSEDIRKVSLNLDGSLLDINIADIQNDSDTDSSNSELAPYLLQKQLSIMPDYLAEIDISLPSLTSLRSTSSEEQTVIVSDVEERHSVKSDHGKFVNPLTGESISTTETSSGEEEGEEEDDGTKKTRGMSSVVSDTEIDIISIESIKDFDKDKKIVAEEENYEAALNELKYSMLKTYVAGDDDTEMEVEVRNRLLVYESTMKFLTGLIDRIVQSAEIFDPDAVLEASLDKKLVLDEIYRKVLEYEKERRVQQYLSTKIIEHYRRIKNIRPILADPAQLRQKHFVNFRTGLTEFDMVLEERRDFLQKQSAAKTADRDLLMNTNELLASEQKNFEHLLNNTFRTKNAPKWKSKIDSFLHKVELKLKEISAERLVLIRKQHTMAENTEKMEKVEHITESLTMSAYERTIASVTKMGSILHDLHVSVEKVRKQTFAYWHLIGHLREHRNLLEIKLKATLKQYNELCDNHKRNRDYACKLKVKHVALQHELNDLSFSVGLLDKPQLMHDYDNTQDAVTELTAVIGDLQKQYEKLQKINELRNEMLKKRSTNKFHVKQFQRRDTSNRPTLLGESISVKELSIISDNVIIKKSFRFSDNLVSIEPA